MEDWRHLQKLARSGDFVLKMKTMHRLLMAGAAALLVAPMSGHALETLDVSGLPPLTEAAHRAQEPSIAAIPGEVAIVWTDRVEQRRVVMGAHRGPAGWTEISALGDAPEAVASDPVVRFGPDGVPVVVWVETEGLRSRLMWRAWNEDSATVISRSDVLIAAPSLAFDAAGEPLVAWFEGGAGQYAVLTAVPAEGSGWEIEPLSTGARAFDVLPTVMGGEEPVVYWYSLADDDEAMVRAARRNPVGVWREVSPGYLTILPTNRLPYLYDAHSTVGPGAVWVDTTGGGERVLTADPRRPLELVVQPVPRDAGARQLDPDASMTSAEGVAFAWREETSAGTAIHVLTDHAHYTLEGIAHPAQPRLASDGAGTLHLAFVSARLEGGTGQLYWLPLEGSVDPGPPVVTSEDPGAFEPMDPVF